MPVNSGGQNFNFRIAAKVDHKIGLNTRNQKTSDGSRRKVTLDRKESDEPMPWNFEIVSSHTAWGKGKAPFAAIWPI